MILLFEQDLEHDYLSIEIVAQFRLIALLWRIQCNFVPKNLVRFTNSEKCVFLFWDSIQMGRI